MKITPLFMFIVTSLCVASCSSTKQVPQSSVLDKTYAENNTSQDDVDLSGAIKITSLNTPQFLDQILFVGIPNTTLEEALVEREFEETVKQSDLYQSLRQEKLESKYVFFIEGNYYFNYKAFRDELVYQGLIKKFGL